MVEIFVNDSLKLIQDKISTNINNLDKITTSYIINI